VFDRGEASGRVLIVASDRDAGERVSRALPDRASVVVVTHSVVAPIEVEDAAQDQEGGACLVLVAPHRGPRIDEWLGAWLSSPRWLDCPIVVVVGDAQARRAALRAGATEVIEARDLPRIAARIDDAHDRWHARRLGLGRGKLGRGSGQSHAQVEQRLRVSEERSRLAQRAANVGVWEFDPRTRETFWSDTMWEIYGHAPSPDVDPRALFEASLHPQDAERIKAYTRDMVATGEQQREEFRIVRPDGSVRWLEVSAAATRSPITGALRYVGVNIDITARKQAMAEVEASEQRLRLAKQAAKLGIHDYDLRTGELRWCERTRELWGIGPDEPVTLARFLAGVHPDDRESIALAHDQALQPSGGGTFSIEYRVVDLVTDETRWIAVTSMVAVEDGEPARMVGTVQDITERKHSEAALRRSEERLRESDRRKDEFMAMLGHELRNPLAAIHSAAELLGIDVAGSPRLARISAVLDRQSNHMVRLVDSLLEVSRIARGKIELTWAIVDLRALLGSVLDDRLAQLHQAGHRASLAVGPAPMWIWADELRLVQVFDNLIANALKFCEQPGEIRIRAERRGAGIAITVSDTGIGIDETMLEAIFEPFLQGAQPLARSAGGLGLGLGLARGLVELHGGTLRAASEGLGCGASFEVWLPIDGRPS
jgi:PAS domain S-box-containing protein